MGRTGRRRRILISCSAASPAVRADTATEPSSPPSMAARRTRGAAIPDAAAIASIMSPSRAPCLNSPTRSRRRNSCSSAVARPSSSPSNCRRRAWEPGPVMAGMRPMASSTSRTSRSGSTAGGVFTAHREAPPTPTRPWRGAPERKPTTISISSGSASASSSASPATFARRDRVEEIFLEVATASSSFIRPAPAPSRLPHAAVVPPCEAAIRPRW